MANGVTPKSIGLVLVLGLFAPASAAAQRCDAAEAWVRSCSTSDVEVRVRDCHAGGVVVSTSVAGNNLVDVEIARGRAHAFREVGELGVSPIAEYADWAEAPEDVRRAFEVVVACVERAPAPLPDGRFVPSGGGPAEIAAPPFPMLLVGALLLACVALGLGVRRARPSRRRIAWAVGPPLAIAIAAYAVRVALTNPSFVHQNGQGPLWVSHALCVPSNYGPGYIEVFGAWVRAIGGEPSAALFQAQAVLAALATGTVWLIARGAFVRPLVAGALAIAVVVEPAFARLAQSESYFGTITSLLLVAAAILSLGAWRRSWKSPVFVASVAAAALLVAQAARIHPLAWLPSAMLPIVVAMGRGRLVTRLRCALAATVGIGAVSAILAGPVVNDLAGGPVGEQWLPQLLRVSPGASLAVAAIGGALIRFAARRGSQGLVRGIAFFLVVAIAFWSSLVAGATPIIDDGYLLLFLPTFVAVLGAGIDGAIRRPLHARAAAAVILVLSLAFAAVRADALFELPTDALEQRWLLARRDELPAGATIVFLGKIGSRRRLHIPFYEECGVGGLSARALAADAAPPDLGSLPPPVVWYRSSMCATDDGLAFCDALERRYRRTRIATTELPARPSLVGLGYTDRTVSVGLYTVDAPR